jgi:hypothetical protein
MKAESRCYVNRSMSDSASHLGAPVVGLEDHDLAPCLGESSRSNRAAVPRRRQQPRRVLAKRRSPVHTHVESEPAPYSGAEPAEHTRV